MPYSKTHFVVSDLNTISCGRVSQADIQLRVISLFGRISKSRLRMQDQSPEMPGGAANSRAGLQKTTCKRSSAGTLGFASRTQNCGY
jgi:hypothetical protein